MHGRESPSSTSEPRQSRSTTPRRISRLISPNERPCGSANNYPGGSVARRKWALDGGGASNEHNHSHLSTCSNRPNDRHKVGPPLRWFHGRVAIVVAHIREDVSVKRKLRIEMRCG